MTYLLLCCHSDSLKDWLVSSVLRLLIDIDQRELAERLYLSMNCWYESSEASHTSMLHGPSSCSLKSEYNDLSTDRRGQNDVKTKQMFDLTIHSTFL